MIDSGFLTGAKDKKESGTFTIPLMGELIMSNDVAGTSTDILSIVVNVFNADNVSSDCAGAFTWEELR